MANARAVVSRSSADLPPTLSASPALVARRAEAACATDRDDACLATTLAATLAAIFLTAPLLREAAVAGARPPSRTIDRTTTSTRTGVRERDFTRDSSGRLPVQSSG